MKRIIIDHSKVTDEILDIILEEYPDGYTDRDVLKFTNHKGELIEALEIKLKEDIYLVKVGTKLDKAIVQHNEDETEDSPADTKVIEIDDEILDEE